MVGELSVTCFSSLLHCCPEVDTVRYRVTGTEKWTLKKLKAGVTSLTFNAAIGTSFTIMKLKANPQYLIAVIATKDQKFNASEPSNSKLVTTMA